MSTPPDHPGGERSPIASTVPGLNETLSDESQAAPRAESTPTETPLRRATEAAGEQGRLSGRDVPLIAHSVRRERQRAREWRRKYPDKARAQKRKARSENYHRPFVAIDAEGQNYPGADIVYDGVRYPRHDTYLWGAAADDGRPPSWLMAAETSGLDKRPLDAVQILDWLLSLPEQFGPAVFVMFSFGYDITQILKHLPYEKAWQIEKRETYPDRNGTQKAHRPFAGAVEGLRDQLCQREVLRRVAARRPREALPREEAAHLRAHQDL